MTVRTNIATNPGAETSLNGWASANAALYPVTADTINPILGKSPMATRTASTPSTVAATFSISGMAASPAWIPISNGVPISLSLDVKTELSDRMVRVYMDQYDSAGGYISATSVVTLINSTVGGAVQRIAATITPNAANAARGYLIVYVTANGGINAVEGERVWVDRLLVENAPTSDGVYFDGDSLDTASVTYAWTGASQASSSTRTEIIPGTLSLDWVASQGAVRFTVLDVPDDDRTTVKRVNPGGTLTAIRGYPDGTWHGTSGLGYDYEAPMSVLVRYAIVDRDAKNLPTTTQPGTVDRVNKAVNPNLETNIAGWFSNDQAKWLVTRGTATPISGTGSALCTRAGTLDSTVASFYVAGASGALTSLPITSAPLTSSLDVKTENDRQVQLSYAWVNSAGATIGSSPVTSKDLTTGVVGRATITETPPAGAVYALLIVGVFNLVGNAVAGERVWSDNLVIEQGTTGSYFDGSTPPSPDHGHRWTGTANASTSERYTLVPVTPTAVIFTQTPGRTNGEAWLRDVLDPKLSQPVSVVSTGEEVYAARQTVLDVAGKRTPYVVWDSRQARQGTVTLATRNTVVSGVYSDSTKRDKLEALFATGRPLLLSMCANKGFRNAYLAIDSVSFVRVGNGPTWLIDMAYFEVDNPTGLGVNIVPEVTYAMAQQLPPNATYQSWAGTGIGDGIRYYDVATRTTLP